MNYNHIPSITKMIPSGGLPGVAYAHCTLASLPAAQKGGWKRVGGFDQTYQITGPSGSVDCMFICIGKPIPGQPVGAGISILWVDNAIPRGTGLKVPDECLDYVEDFQQGYRQNTPPATHQPPFPIGEPVPGLLEPTPIIDPKGPLAAIPLK